MKSPNSKRQVTGLTWASSDTNKVSLSSAYPPVLTAVGLGRATITAGSGSADLTVYPASAALPLGTTLWSVPGNVYKIVPAVPSPSGVADVFAFLADGNTVQAITSDGTTAWTGDVTGLLEVVPDFQGGLVGYSDSSMVRLDGMTGQRSTVYTPGGTSYLGAPGLGSSLVVHPDGTIFALQMDYTPGSLFGWTPAVVGVDPTTGLKFKTAMPPSVRETYGLIIAGDGNAYAPYLNITGGFEVPCHDGSTQLECGWQNGQIMLLRLSSAGASNSFQVYNSVVGCGDFCIDDLSMITNADQGAVVSWSVAETVPGGNYDINSCCSPTMHMALTSGGGASLVSAPVVAGQTDAVEPVLQAQDGSFVGTAWDGNGASYMVAFDASGNVRWTVPGYTPQIATADGGVVATDASGAAVTFDQNGNATGQTGNLPTLSWTGSAYHVGSVSQIVAAVLNYAVSYAAFWGGNLSGSLAYVLKYDTPQEALSKLAATNLAGPPGCSQLMAQFASMAHMPESTLIAQLKAAAVRASKKTHDGPSSTVQMNSVDFPTDEPFNGTVGAWFGVDQNREGLSQFNSDDVWFRLNDWLGWMSKFFIHHYFFFQTGQVNYYGMGTVMHEILHKQAVGGGFTHLDMDAVIQALGATWPGRTLGNNEWSDGFGKLCFGNLGAP